LNRCNNCLRCCKEGISCPVYMVLIFVALFFLMLLVFILLGLAGRRIIG
jgi:hypothetical protein